MKTSLSAAIAIIVLSLAAWVFFYLTSGPLTAPETTVVVGFFALVVISAKWLWPEDRIRCHLLAVYAGREIGSIDRDELQDALEQKAEQGLSFSTIDHLRWDLRQIFGMAVFEGYLQRNPAALLFTPRRVTRPVKRRMTWEEVRLLFSVLQLRELLIAKLAVLTGMRPGELFALNWRHVKEDRIQIEQRMYRGQLDSPKTHRSIRTVATSDGVQALLREWKEASLDTSDGRLGVSLRNSQNAFIKRQLLAALYRTQTEGGRPGVGQLSRNASHQLFAHEGTKDRPQGGR